MSKKNGEKQQEHQVDKSKKATGSQSPKRVLNNDSVKRPSKGTSQNPTMTRPPKALQKKSKAVPPQSLVTNDVGLPQPPQHKQHKLDTSKPVKKLKQPKRITHKMARRKKLVKRIITGIISATLLSVCIVMSLKLLFIVRTIDVKGSELFSSEDIITFCAIPLESNIFSVNTKELEKNIVEEFTYIESVKVQKKLPDKIAIQISDSVESYYTLTDEKINIYSQSFKFLRTGDTVPSDMLCLNFDMQNKEISDVAVQIIEMFKLHEIKGMTELNIENTSDIRAEYEDRLEIKFGTILDMEYKIKMFKKLIDDGKIPLDETGVLDATKGGEIVYKRQ